VRHADQRVPLRGLTGTASPIPSGATPRPRARRHIRNPTLTNSSAPQPPLTPPTNTRHLQVHRHLHRRARRPAPPADPAGRLAHGCATHDEIVTAIRDDHPDPSRSDTILRGLLVTDHAQRDASTVVLHALAPALRSRLGRAITDEYRSDALTDPACLSDRAVVSPTDVADLVAVHVDLHRFLAAAEAAVDSGRLSSNVWAAYRIQPLVDTYLHAA
jgi:hypothetical protein